MAIRSNGGGQREPYWIHSRRRIPHDSSHLLPINRVSGNTLLIRFPSRTPLGGQTVIHCLGSIFRHRSTRAIFVTSDNIFLLLYPHVLFHIYFIASSHHCFAIRQSCVFHYNLSTTLLSVPSVLSLRVIKILTTYVNHWKLPEPKIPRSRSRGLKWKMCSCSTGLKVRSPRTGVCAGSLSQVVSRVNHGRNGRVSRDTNREQQQPRCCEDRANARSDKRGGEDVPSARVCFSSRTIRSISRV